MSGRKYSAYALNQERELLEKTRADVKKRTQELHALRHMIIGLHQEIDRQKLTLQPEQLSQVNAWLDKTSSGKMGSIQETETDGSRWSKILGELDNSVDSGKTVHGILVTAHETRLLQAELQTQMSDVSLLVNSSREQVVRWFGQSKMIEIDETLMNLVTEIENDADVGLRKKIDTLRVFLTDIVTQANNLEFAHRKRVYLLDCLKKLCADMGFEEIEPWRFEKVDDYNSSIILSVDTFAYGAMTFYLALDKIFVDSPIVKTSCATDFNELSQRLIKYYGIRTDFQIVGQELPGNYKAIDEISEPEDRNRNAT